MAKTRLQELQDKKFDVLLQLDEVNAKIDFHKSQPFDKHHERNLNRNYRDPKIVSLEEQKVVLTKKLERIEEEIATLVAQKGSKKKEPSKQETTYKAVEAMLKKNREATKEDCFDRLSDETGDSVGAVRKAYYAEQSKRLGKGPGKKSKLDELKAASPKRDDPQ